MNPKEEAKKIVDLIFEELGTAGITRGPVPYVDGRYAIQEMKEKELPSWKENEWQGYYLKHLVRELCDEKCPGIESYTEGKNYLVKGEYLWDVRNKTADEEIPTILFSNQVMNKFLDEFGGIGVIIADSVAYSDENGDFRRWHEELKGGESEYTKKRKAEGRPPRKMKTAFVIIKVGAYYFTEDDFKKGVAQGWLDRSFQRNMRQFNGSSRGGKCFYLFVILTMTEMIFQQYMEILISMNQKNNSLLNGI